ncbi:MAG TPA: ChaN family lipoprotein [Candidatus Polarisedimenticolia bacterium]|nr:ChaN family lipoprotein [Candidatus Polarisedimenticolia bacterium]
MATAQLKEEIAFHRRMVSLLKREISRVDPNASRRYLRDFQEEFSRLREIGSYDDLVIACYKADLIYVGDYHALPSSQAAAAKLLREVASRSRHVIVAVEMVYGRNQRALDRWMAREIDDEEFKRAIRYDLEWGYDWNGFRQILDAARDYGVRAFGIDCAPRNGLKYIRRRDQYAATRLADIFRRNPAAKVVVVIGESHLASGHLPNAVRAELRSRNLEKRSVRVVQNVEEIYWQLVARGEEHRDVVVLAKNTYCIFNTSPIAKYESYRQTINRWKSEQADDDHLDLTPTIHSMIDTILRFLSVDKFRHCVRREGACTEYLVDFYPEVYSHLDATTLRRVLHAGGLSKVEMADIKKRIARNGSCYIPRINSIFIGQFSLVHGGEEAAHFVNLALRGDVLRDEAPLRARPDLFYIAVIEEALGFFGSKLIDPSRNHFFETKLYQYHRQDRAFIEANTEYTYEQFSGIISFILGHKRFEKTYGKHDEVPGVLLEGVRTRNRRLFSVLTHELGYYLGQQLYDGYHQGEIDRSEIAALFRTRFDGQGTALAAYLDLVERLPGITKSD